METISNLYVHIAPKIDKKIGRLLLPVVLYKNIGEQPIEKYVLERNILDQTQFHNVLDNMDYAIDKMILQKITADTCLFVTNNQTVVTWFKKGATPVEYVQKFDRLRNKFQKLNVRRLGVTCDITCNAEKYATKLFITDSDVTETEQCISIVELFSREGMDSVNRDA